MLQCVPVPDEKLQCPEDGRCTDEDTVPVRVVGPNKLGHLHWTQEMDWTCFTELHLLTTYFAVAGLALWTVGANAMMLRAVAKRRHRLTEYGIMERFSFLYSGLELKFWSWEGVKLLQNLAYAVIYTIPEAYLPTELKLVFVSVNSGVALFLHLVKAPYEDRKNGLLDEAEVVGTASVFAQAFCFEAFLLYGVTTPSTGKLVYFLVLVIQVWTYWYFARNWVEQLLASYDEEDVHDPRSPKKGRTKE